MASFKTSEHQSYFDVAIQKLGSVEATFQLALNNGGSITDELSPGTNVTLSEVRNTKLTDYFANKNIVPATYADSASSQNENTEVIYWSADLQKVSGIKVSEKQSLFDVAIQKGGSLETMVELALINGISITEDLSPGQHLDLPEVVNSDIATYFSNKGIVPETTIYESDELTPVLEGIDYWAIEVDFIVS